METVSFLVSNAGTIVQGAAEIVGGAAVVAAVLPTPRASAWLSGLRRLLDLIAFNIGNAKNGR
jgi:hypothetical protein